MMSTQDVPLSFRDPEAAVFRPGEFYGREGLVRNLLWRLERRETLSILGGPKLGKTSLLLHLAWQLNYSSPGAGLKGVPAIYFDLSVQEDRQRFLATEANSRSVLLLDNCDHVLTLDENILSKSFDFNSALILYAGSREWREFIRSDGLKRQVRPIPLSVFLEKEAHQVLGGNLSSEQQADILAQAGTHPYVLKTLIALFLAKGEHCSTEDVSQEAVAYLLPFFQRCGEAIREPMEHDVLARLVKAAVPINPREVARSLGLPTIKPIADTLCVLGLIRRWIQDEEATLFAGCRLFNEWYLESTTSLST